MTVNKNPAHEYFTNQNTNSSKDEKETGKLKKAAKNCNLSQAKTSPRKFFRIKDEKASKSINNQNNCVKSLLEVIQEEVKNEKNKYINWDQTTDENLIDINSKTFSKTIAKSLTKELPRSKIKS